MDNEELNNLYKKISKDTKYKPIIDCIKLNLNDTYREQFIAKEQLLDRCGDDSIIYKISQKDLTENQILGMVNNELRNKNELLLKQNIKLREGLKSFDNNWDINSALDKIELEYYKKENNKLKYYIRNYSSLSKDLYTLQQMENLIHVNRQKDLLISNEINIDNYDKTKLVEHLESCNKLLVYNYYDSCNLSHNDTREFISQMNELISDNKYIDKDDIIYNDLLSKISDLECQLEHYKTDEKLFMYHVEKVSYNILKEIAKKNKKDNLSVPFTCLSVAITELNQIKNKLDRQNINIDELENLFIVIKNCMDGYDKGFLNMDTEKNLKLLKKYIDDTKKYKDKCDLYEEELNSLQKIARKQNKQNDYNDLIEYIYKIVSSKKYDNSNNEKCKKLIDTINSKELEKDNYNIYALKHYIYYLINTIISKK